MRIIVYTYPRINYPAMPKTSKNLYLDEKLVERAEKFGREHGTNLSTLVADFLDALTRATQRRHGPIVQRLLGAGVARGTRRARTADRDDYKDHLVRKYGRSR